MEYTYWKWNNGDEKMQKTNIKRKIREIEENMRNDLYDSLKMMNEKNNNKEMCSKRLSEREQLKQRVHNPFLCNNNYLSDLSIQENYLKPKNSSFEPLEQ